MTNNNIVSENLAAPTPANELIAHFFTKSTRSFIEERFKSLCSAQ